MSSLISDLKNNSFIILTELNNQKNSSDDINIYSFFEAIENYYNEISTSLAFINLNLLNDFEDAYYELYDLIHSIQHFDDYNINNTIYHNFDNNDVNIILINFYSIIKKIIAIL